MYEIKKNNLFLLTVCVCAFFLSFSIAYAQPRPYQWDDSLVVNGKLTLGINSDLVDNSYYSAAEITTGLEKWMSTSANLNVTETSFSLSKIDIASVTNQQWLNNGWSTDFLAWEQSWAGSKACKDSTIGPRLCDSTDAVTYSVIYLNEGNMPTGLLPSTRKKRREAMLAHELGHSFQLDHNSYIGHDSIMRDLVWNDARFSFDPTVHDENNINSMYY